MTQANPEAPPAVNELAQLRMPGQIQLLPALLDFARRLCQLQGFGIPDLDRIELALEEVCTDVIAHALSTEEGGVYDVSFHRRLDGIEIVVHDMGLPYDPTRGSDYDPGHIGDDLSGLGQFLAKKMMDAWQFDNLGNQGKAIRLLKYFDSVNVGEAHGEHEAEVPQDQAPSPPEGARPEIRFSIRRMQADEAIEVCRCIYDCYGYSYANENVYYPERVVAMNQRGQLASHVAVSDSGEVGGHFALILYEDLPAEIGIAVTKKKFRGHGFARQLGNALEADARDRGLDGLQVKQVTAHPFTQKFSAKLGFRDCGLLLAHSPKSLSFKGIADQLQQRNSDVIGFKFLSPPSDRRVHAPARHRDMIGRLYANLGAPVAFAEPESTVAAPRTVMQTRVHTLRALAEMSVSVYGGDFIPVMREELRRLFIDEIRVIEIYLSLDDPLTPAMAEALERMGFFFTGILPQTRRGDALVMQYLHGIQLDFSRLVVVGEVAQSLLEYVQAQIELR